MLGLDNEQMKALATVGAALGFVVASAIAAFKSAVAEKKRDDQGPDLIDVRGESRQLRQEVRLEHKDTRQVICDEHRETREGVSGNRDLLIEIRAILRSDR